MNRSLSALDRETQLLIAAGSAVAAGCIPCLETIVGMARTEGVDERKLKEAVMTGQYVKEQPINMMKECADRLVGTHLCGKPLEAEAGCPLSGNSGGEVARQEAFQDAGCGAGGCGCSAPEEQGRHGGIDQR
jgi:AhpD family alkylhydroperoxidase